LLKELSLKRHYSITVILIETKIKNSLNEQNERVSGKYIGSKCGPGSENKQIAEKYISTIHSGIDKGFVLHH
jgi:hypothetical protein